MWCYGLQSVLVLSWFTSKLQDCGSRFDFKCKGERVFHVLVRLFGPRLALFLVSSILFPSRQERVDLEEYYFAKRRPIFGLLAGLMLYYWILSLSFSLLSAVQFAGVAMTATLIVTDNRAIHAALTLVYAISTLLFVASFSYTLGESAF